jgi:hypothetical protein
MRAVCDLCGSLIEFFNMITSSRSLFTEERSEENREEAAAPASLPESYSSVLVFSVFFLERTAIPVVARWIETKAAGAVTFHETRKLSLYNRSVFFVYYELCGEEIHE